MTPTGDRPVVLRRRLAETPADHAPALDYARSAMASGDGDAVAIWLGAAAALAPFHLDLAEPLRELGRAYLDAGRPDRAAQALHRATTAHPWDWSLWNDLAVAHDRCSRVDDAGRAFRISVAIAPDSTMAAGNLADLLFRTGDHDAALRISLHSVGDADALATAGNSALRLARADLAARCFRRATALVPSFATALIGAGVAAMTDQHIEKAGRSWHRAKALVPGDVGLNNNLATWYLTQGDYRRGFALYEWRWRRPEAQAPRRGLPEWQGENLEGRRIVLYQEQGLGDVLQMIRYVPTLTASGASVLIECSSTLHRLFASLPGSPRLVRPGAAVDADLQAPIMSLPRLLGTELDTVPATVPYLAADESLVRTTASLVAGTGKRIGLVWQGNPRQVDEPHRSIPLRLLAPLLELGGATFYGLQRDHGREQMDDPRVRGRLVDLGPGLDDLATTAAILMHLDLVVTTCTAMAHLAGALGRPVWVLLKRGADWRWLLDRSDSPWYPTARLFRQRRVGDWQGVADEVTSMARTLIA